MFIKRLPADWSYTSTTRSRNRSEQSRRTLQAPPTSTTPTAAPTASSGCNQLGCPYPAVCDKTSGVCTINQAQGPAAAPQAPGAEIIANNPGANSLVPACPPPPLTISKITSFCANPSANQGGATIVWSDNPVTPQAFSSYYLIEDGYQTGGNGKEDNWNSNQTVFSGPQGTNVVMTYCSVCSTVPSLVTWNGYQQYLGTTGNDQVLPGFGDPSACPTGYYGPQCDTLYNYQNGYTDLSVMPLFSHAPAEPIMIMANKTVLTMLLERSLLLARPAIPICSPGSLVITRHSVIKILFQSPITACLIRFRLDHVWFRRSRNRACPTRWFPEAANS